MCYTMVNIIIDLIKTYYNVQTIEQTSYDYITTHEYECKTATRHITHPHQICQTHYRLEILAHELCIKKPFYNMVGNLRYNKSKKEKENHLKSIYTRLCVYILML